MAAINGTDLTLFIPQDGSAWIPIGLSKSCSLSISADTPDISTKDSSGWSEVIAGMKSFTMDFEALVSLTDDASANGLLPLWTYFSTRTKIKVAWGKEGTYWYGDAYISSLEESAEAEQPVSFSGSLTGTGALTYGNQGESGTPTYPGGFSE
jgi:TP901-1 family phage major tail protein